jgi:hypothetical protein
MKKEDAIQLFREECLKSEKEGHSGAVAPQTGRDSKDVPAKK